VRSVFNPAFTTTAGRQYIEGVGSLAGAYIALACVLFIAFGTTFIVACCCRQRLCKPVKRGGKTSCLVGSTCGLLRLQFACVNFLLGLLLIVQGACCGCIFSPRLWYLAAVICLLAGASTALAVLSKVQNSINTTVHGFQDFNSLLNNANSNVDNGLLPAVSLAGNQTQDLVNALNAASAPAAAIAAASTLSASITSLSSQLSEVSVTVKCGGPRIGLRRVGACVLSLCCISIHVSLSLPRTAGDAHDRLRNSHP
jgi:hypothetical protein